MVYLIWQQSVNPVEDNLNHTVYTFNTIKLFQYFKSFD